MASISCGFSSVSLLSSDAVRSGQKSVLQCVGTFPLKLFSPGSEKSRARDFLSETRLHKKLLQFCLHEN